MKYYRHDNVYDAALERIRWLYDEFPNVVVCFSGGKDSTVIFNLTLQVAKERGRLPLAVMFVDQEAEWQATIDLVHKIMERPDVQPYWLQVPIKLFNATSTKEHWLYCWDVTKEDKWMREKVSYSLKENIYKTDRFAKMFDNFLAVTYEGQKACMIGGVRTEESPSRMLGLTTRATYKWATYGKALNRAIGQYTFYPIYDWGLTDVWKAIHDNKWEYNAMYDFQYSYGMSITNMRISNVHHETSVHSLFYMQEVEPQTYEKLTQRIEGIDTAGKVGKDDFFVSDLPYMFVSWKEYRDFLLDKLITDEDWLKGFRATFKRMDATYGGSEVEIGMWKTHVNAIICNDWEFIKIGNWEANPSVYNIRRKLEGKSYYER